MAMPPLDSIIAVALAGLALSATPGPSMLYVLSRTVGQSRAAGLASALGLCLGGILLAIVASLGLGAALAASPGLLGLIRYAGSAYLIWLGLGMIRDAQRVAQTNLSAVEVGRSPLLKVMWQGVLVELLNPKTVLFLALFLPPFVAASQSSEPPAGVTLQLLVLGVIVPLTAVPSDLLVAFLGGTLAQRLNRSRKSRVWLSRVAGLTLIGIAVSLHLSL
jgi:threonine/homoserine/homoserine lactone efflux protein